MQIKTNIRSFPVKELSNSATLYLCYFQYCFETYNTMIKYHNTFHKKIFKNTLLINAMIYHNKRYTIYQNKRYMIYETYHNKRYDISTLYMICFNKASPDPSYNGEMITNCGKPRSNKSESGWEVFRR